MAVETPEQSFEDLTRSLNFITSRLAFHEMRINVNRTIMGQLIQYSRDLVSEAKDDEFKKTRLAPVSTWLEKSLQRLQIECQALLLEVACNQKIAQSQLDIVIISLNISTVLFLTVYRCITLLPSVIRKTI